MHIEARSILRGDNRSIGQIYIDGKFEGYFVENHNGPKRIPVGVYDLKKTFFGNLKVTHVPGFGSIPIGDFIKFYPDIVDGEPSGHSDIQLAYIKKLYSISIRDGKRCYFEIIREEF